MPYRKPVSNLPLDLIQTLQERYGLRYFVETGTFRGDTAQRAASFFPKVWTCEVHLPLYLESRRRLADWPNVVGFLSPSPRFLAEAVKWCDQPTLFWLDAHYSGNGTGQADGECPLMEELLAIGDLRGKHVLLIDDLRMFKGIVGPTHNPNDWPTLDAIEALLKTWPSPVAVSEHGDILQVVPCSA